MKYEAVIGLEIHVQINAATKLFCDCPNRPGDEPTSTPARSASGSRGHSRSLARRPWKKRSLPAWALNCAIQPVSAFDQKVYYYPDLPKGYQLSQHHKP